MQGFWGRGGLIFVCLQWFTEFWKAVNDKVAALTFRYPRGENRTRVVAISGEAGERLIFRESGVLRQPDLILPKLPVAA
jgi:hypothetical protein